MTDYTNAPELKASVLGKSTEYAQQYDASLLHPIARKLNRDQIAVSDNITVTPAFFNIEKDGTDDDVSGGIIKTTFNF